MSPATDWPSVPDEYRWVLELMEEQLSKTHQSPEQLLVRAAELRRHAAQTDIRGFRDAAIALAARYEVAAAAHPVSI